MFISALNRKDRLGDPTHVTKTVGVENRATAISNKVAFRKKIFRTKEITEYNTYEAECLFYSQLSPIAKNCGTKQIWKELLSKLVAYQPNDNN